MITGRILLENSKPMAHGIVAFFDKKTGPAPNPSQYFRLPDHIAPLDKEGKFSITIPTEQFYVGAILFHPDRESKGPPQKGDITLTVKDEMGKPKLFAMPANGDDIHLGTVVAGNLYDLEEEQTQLTAVSGTIFYRNKSRAEGVKLVAAKNSPGTAKAFVYTSQDTESSGDYLLRLPGAGTYTVRLSKPETSGPHFVVKNEENNDYLEKKEIVISVKKGQIPDGFDLIITV